ncbi:MAG: heavy metal translocating P-type ATPase [Gammaproteobacteria bacterium]|nr:heavy metal translocating P-type ATPase [Gammaproteobacteria bacterium]
MERCFHCNEPVPPGTNYSLEANGERRQFCCPGCRAVAELISSQGLARFYDFRSAPALRATEREGADDPWAVCDRPEVERRLTRSVGAGRKEFRYRVDGLNCAACAWLIDRGLSVCDGVEDVSVDPVSHEVLVSFDPERVRVSQILDATERYGFVPRLGSGTIDESDKRAARDELKRLAVAGLGFAQVMTLSAALYLGAFSAMDASYAGFFVFASMLIATPVVLYSGAPIFRGALIDLARGRIGMDVPVGLAISIALGASLVNAFRGAGHVYFDSATMFVFFLTLGRFLETRARHRAGGLVSALAELRPLSALRRQGGALERVGTVELEAGDLIVVEPGEAVPADGELVSELGTFDESLLSGESLGRHRERGEAVLGGSINVGRAPLEIRVTQSGNDGYIDRVGSLLHRAMADRPAFLRLADRWASMFVAAVLVATAITGGYWLYVQPERALDVVLAMLVVTCPCALSLAAPTAFAVSLGRLARLGLLCRSARVLERLGQVSVWLFDKTGTLTDGRTGIVRVETLGQLGETESLALAAALEAGIEHPIARALRSVADVPGAEAVEYVVGFGVTGRVAGRSYRLGSARHVGRDPAEDDARCVYLADEEHVLARIVLADQIRPHAREAIIGLAADAEVALVSGDSMVAVSEAARTFGIDRFAALQTPEDKLARLRDRQAAGDVVAAVGDGINDAPLLAQADVSIAMVAGSQLAQASADVVFTGDDLRTLVRLPELARATRVIVRQNLAWAALYNLSALPLAAAGILAPWMAALGMSFSSLVVVGNALRLNRKLADPTDPRESAFAGVPAEEPGR